jgi:uncharacterized DUF497 family protein
MQNEVFYDPAAYTSRSPHTVGERRYVTVGLMRGALVAVDIHPSWPRHSHYLGAAGTAQ